MTIHPAAAVLGWPIEHSLSPRLHGYWLQHYGMAGSYVAMAVEPARLGETLKSLHSKGMAGVNLTVPHKEAALSFVDEIEPLARRVGAINTVVVRADGTLYGRNTDVYGFSQNLISAGFKPSGPAATLIGAGGASRAGLAALIDMGFTDIRLINRTRDKAEKMAGDFGEKNIRVFDFGDAAALDGSCLLANATSLGLKGQPPLDIALDALPTAAWVTDMVYVPLETEFLRRARERGNKTVDGLGMLLHQARPAFQAFFGRDPEVTAALREMVLKGKA